MRTTTRAVPAVNVDAIRFQRFVVGCALLAFYVFEWMPLAYAVDVVLMAAVLLPFGYDPLGVWYLLYVRVKRPRTLGRGGALVDRSAERFGTILYAGLVMIGITAYYVFGPPPTRCLFLVVGTVALVAGTTGFCLFSAVSAAVRPAEVVLGGLLRRRTGGAK
jgi:hypothetical protein